MRSRWLRFGPWLLLVTGFGAVLGAERARTLTHEPGKPITLTMPDAFDVNLAARGLRRVRFFAHAPDGRRAQLAAGARVLRGREPDFARQLSGCACSEPSADRCRLSRGALHAGGSDAARFSHGVFDLDGWGAGRAREAVRNLSHGAGQLFCSATIIQG